MIFFLKKKKRRRRSILESGAYVLGKGERRPDTPCGMGMASYISGPEELGFSPEGLEMLKVENKMCHVFKEFPV